MAKRTPVPFNTPPGRFVGGSLYQGSTKDDKGNIKTYKTGANAGQPRTDYSVGIAIAKTQPHWASEPGWGQAIWAEGHAAWPSGQAQHPSFAWKVVDGDSTIPNKRMKKPCDQEGYPGHWVLWFSGTTPPKLAVAIGTEPQWNDQPGFCMPGDIIEIRGSVSGNESSEAAGVYLNFEAVCMRAYHKEGRIVGQGVDLATAGFGASPLPAGASAMPVGNALAGQPPAAPPVPGATPSTPVAPPVPVSPAPASSPVPAVPLAPITPNPAILGAPGPVSVPPAPVPLPVQAPPPAPAKPVMKDGSDYDAWITAGWTHQQMVDGGHLA